MDDTRMIAESYFDGIVVFFKSLQMQSDSSRVQKEVQL